VSWVELSALCPSTCRMLYLEPVFASVGVLGIIGSSIARGIPYIRMRHQGRLSIWQGVVFALLLASHLQQRIVSFSADETPTSSAQSSKTPAVQARRRALLDAGILA